MPRHRQHDDEPGLWTSRSFVGSALVIGALVVAGLVLSVLGLVGRGQDETTTRQSVGASAGHAGSPPASVSGAGSATPSAEPSVCGLPGVEWQGSLTQAPRATWSLLGTTAAPSMAKVGPGRIESDGYRSCYSHTVTGALLAAANYVAIGSEVPLMAKLNARGVAPGPGRDALLKQPSAAGGSDVRIQISGFRVLRYTGDQADIDLAINTSKGAIAAGVLHLQWVEGDWKLRVADDGSSMTNLAQLPSLEGYILWSGA